MREGESLKGTERILGDVVISAETAVKQARRYKKKVDDEIRLYLAHGILHLAGYDDTTARLRKKMCRLQEEILEK
jgi:probable rRNA maturation factor